MTWACPEGFEMARNRWGSLWEILQGDGKAWGLAARRGWDREVRRMTFLWSGFVFSFDVPRALLGP